MTILSFIIIGTQYLKEMDVGMKKNQLDQQWFTLILEAKKIGLSVEEIRNFLHSTSTEELSKISSITIKT